MTTKYTIEIDGKDFDKMITKMSKVQGSLRWLYDPYGENDPDLTEDDIDREKIKNMIPETVEKCYNRLDDIIATLRKAETKSRMKMHDTTWVKEACHLDD